MQLFEGFIVLILFFAVVSPMCADEICIDCTEPLSDSVNYSMDAVKNDRVDELQKMFEEEIPVKDAAVYTKVPRGLIVSVDEKVFFNKGSVKIRESSLPILKGIASVVRQINNEFIIEGHNKDEDLSKLPHELNWELSLERANNISKYLVLCEKINIDNIFTLGFGDMAPYESNVSKKMKLDNRIDFIILDYSDER